MRRARKTPLPGNASLSEWRFPLSECHCPGGRTYSLGSDTAICLVINESDGTAGEPCSSSQRRSVQVRERLTASFDGLPDSHDGQTAFSFRIQFSEDIDATVDGMRDHALNVSGGTVTGAARVNVSGCVKARLFGEQRRARSGDRRCR